MEPDVIIILSSGIVPYWNNKAKDISYKTTTYDYYDAYGTLGGHDRIRAGAILAKNFPLSKLMTTSSLGISDRPSHAKVAREELITLGVHASRIVLEENSNNLRSQLIETIRISEKHNWSNLLFITSEFHIARAQLMLDEVLIDKLKAVKIISSEGILLSDDDNFFNEFKKIKNSTKYITRIQNEESGVKAFREGSYCPSLKTLKTEKYEKKAILISGTSSGLGESFFKNLYNKDFDLYCLSRSFLTYQIDISSNENGIFLICCDLTKLDKLGGILEKLRQCLTVYKEIIFINNAGSILPVNKIGALNNDEIISSVNLNYIAPALIANMLLNLKEVSIKVLNISSGAANSPVDGWSTYCSAKAASKMFFDVLSFEVKNKKDYSVNQIDPGIIDTKIQCQIRNLSKDIFPKVNEFIEFKNSKKLLNPNDAALKIIKKYILNENSTAF